MGIIQKIEKTKQRFNRDIDNSISTELSAFQRFMIYVDFKIEQLLHGVAVSNYFQYEFYKKNRVGRNEFLCKRDMKEIYELCNPEKFRYLTGDKTAFNSRFSKYLRRDWLDVSKSSFDEFRQFLASKDKVFVKPVDGECGIGACVINIEEIENIEALYQQYRDAKVIMEELVLQSKEMAAFNSSSVNTIRVVTLRDSYEKINVMAGVIRIGRAGEVADNFHHNGICAAIDVNTGIVVSTAIDYNHNRYVLHPDSKKQVVGFQVPQWDDILKTVKEAAELMVELRYIGWDVAINEQGQVLLIEANSTPDTNVTQIADQLGKKKDYEPIMRELCKQIR